MKTGNQDSSAVKAPDAAGPQGPTTSGSSIRQGRRGRGIAGGRRRFRDALPDVAAGHRFEGEILPVNPKGGEIAGPRSLRSRGHPGRLDLIVIAVPRRQSPDPRGRPKKGAAGAVIITSGFRELGTSEGIGREDEVRRIAASGIRVIGPNCFGIYCPKSGLTFFPNPDLSRESGPIAFLSQSGGLASDFMMTGMWMGLRFSKVVSFGNGADLREAELLRYLADDPETGVIAM